MRNSLITTLVAEPLEGLVAVGVKVGVLVATPPVGVEVGVFVAVGVGQVTQGVAVGVRVGVGPVACQISVRVVELAAAPAYGRLYISSIVRSTL